MNNNVDIQEVDIVNGSLLSTEIESPVYKDALSFTLESANEINIEELVRNFFLSQPMWLLALMINLASRSKLKLVIKNAEFSPGFALGHWKVTNTHKNEIVFGESLGFIEHRLSFYKTTESENRFMTMSSIKTHNKFGEFYFYFVKMVHLKLVKYAIRNLQKKYTLNGR